MLFNKCSEYEQYSANVSYDILNDCKSPAVAKGNTSQNRISFRYTRDNTPPSKGMDANNILKKMPKNRFAVFLLFFIFTILIS